MPVDASIYSMIRPQQAGPGPLELAGQAFQIRHLLNANQQQEQALAEDAAVRQAFAGMQPGQTVKDLLPDVFKASPKTGVSMQKQVTEQEAAEAAKNKNLAETHGMQVKQLRDQLASVQDDNGLALLRESATKLYGPKAVQSMPQTVSDPNFAAWREKQLLTGDELVKRFAPNYQIANLGGSSRVIQTNPNAPGATTGDLEHTQTPGEALTDKRAREQMAQAEKHFQITQNNPPLQHVELSDGMYVFNPKTGKYAKSLGQNGESMQGAKGLTESQGKATGLALRAQNAHDILSNLENEGTLTPGIIKQGVSGVPLVGGALEMGVNKLPTYLGGPSSAQQRVEQAQRDFVNAALRVESGASINQTEFDNARKQYFPQPGDDKKTIEQKKRNREIEIQSLKLQAGPGAKNVVGSPASPVGRKRDSMGGVLTQNADGSFSYGFGR